MTNRIRDIAIDVMVKYINDADDWAFTTEELDKIGEILVRECIKVAIEEAEFCELKMMPFSTMEWKILERFGIKNE